MNWQNKEGDIRQILENQEFAFNPQDWEGAEKLLLLRKKRRKRRRLLIISLPVVLLIALGLYFAPDGDSHTPPVAKNNPEKTVEINTEKRPSGDNSIINTLPKDVGDDAASRAIPSNNIAEKTKPVTPAQPPPSAIGTLKDYENNKAGKNNPVINDRENEVSEENSILPTENENKLNQGLQPLTITEDVAAIESTDTIEDLTDTEPEPEKTEIASRKDKDKDEPALKNKIGFTAGGNYSRLLSVKHGRFVVLPYFAVNYGYIFNAKWQLGIGLAYSAVNSGGLQKRYSVNRHSFGETHTELTVQTTRLHYLEMPVLARYNFNNKLFFTGGINAAYLLGIKGSVNENNSGLFAQRSDFSKNASDYRGGIKPWDMQLQLGAEMLYRKRFYLGGLVSGGLLDIGGNKYYNSSAFERNLRLQLYIRYELWNF